MRHQNSAVPSGTLPAAAGYRFAVIISRFNPSITEALAAGDSILALDGLPRAQIYGDYTQYQQQLEQGAPTCPPETFPQFAPGPGT